MPAAFLVLHGIENHRPPGHWQFWLAGRLAEQGHQVLYPSLPDADAPRFAAWSATLHDQLAELDGTERVVVCHSLACLLWFREAASIAGAARADRLLIVSPPASDQLPATGAEFAVDALDAAAIRASVTGEIRVACSDADPYNPVGALAMYAEPIGAEVEIVHGGEHITPDSGYGPWPWVLDWCLGV